MNSSVQTTKQKRIPVAVKKCFWLPVITSLTLVVVAISVASGWKASQPAAGNIPMAPQFKYDEAYSFRDGLAPVKLNGKYGFIDKTGSEVIPLIYEGASTFSEGLAVVKTNGKYGFIDKKGKLVIPAKFEDAGRFFEGLALIGLNGKYGYIDKT